MDKYVYKFADSTKSTLEAGQEGVSERDICNLVNVIKSENKHLAKQNKFDVISMEIVLGDEHFDNESESFQIQLTNPDTNVEVIVEVNETHRELHKAIHKLLPQQQELIYKIHFLGYSIVSIANAEGVTESAIRDRLRKAYKQLKKYLKKF